LGQQCCQLGRKGLLLVELRGRIDDARNRLAR